MSATFLVTGFEPFAEHRTNASWDALTLLRPSWAASIAALCLPVDYHAAHELLRRAVDALQPRAVLCTGLARGEVFRIERQARHPLALQHVAGEPESRGRWPWEEMSDALRCCGVRSVESEDAGQYVCESTYWSLLNYSGTRDCAGANHPSGTGNFGSATFDTKPRREGTPAGSREEAGTPSSEKISPASRPRFALQPEFAAFLHVPPTSAACPLELIARSVGQVVVRRFLALNQQHATRSQLTRG